MKARPDGWNRDMPERADAGDRDVDLPERMPRAGSPVPVAIEHGNAAQSWQDIKSRFVDDPAGAIAAAEELIRLAVDQKVRALNDEAAAIVAPGPDDDARSTEALRTRLIRYQEYCQRLAETVAH